MSPQGRLLEDKNSSRHASQAPGARLYKRGARGGGGGQLCTRDAGMDLQCRSQGPKQMGEFHALGFLPWAAPHLPRAEGTSVSFYSGPGDSEPTILHADAPTLPVLSRWPHQWDVEDSAVGFLGGFAQPGDTASNLRAGQSLTTHGDVAPQGYSRRPTCVTGCSWVTLSEPLLKVPCLSFYEAGWADLGPMDAQTAPNSSHPSTGRATHIQSWFGGLPCPSHTGRPHHACGRIEGQFADGPCVCLAQGLPGWRGRIWMV